MHELGVVFSIIKTVEEVAAENDVTEVSAVKLHLGEVSTVITHLRRNQQGQQDEEVCQKRTSHLSRVIRSMVWKVV